MKESDAAILSSILQKFTDEHHIRSKGNLSAILIITQKAMALKPRYKEEDFLTPGRGQVAGLGGQAVQNILARHGITRILAEEGGRTSRGNMKRMQAYLAALNDWHELGLLDFGFIESWWIDKIKEFFSAQPLRIKIDGSKSLRSIVKDLIKAAFDRQQECKGTMVAGAVIQHLVGAKLHLAMPAISIKQEGFSVADAPGNRKGDFLIQDAAIHVTTAPTEALIRKCKANLDENLRPIIITTELGANGAKALAMNFDIADRVDILEIEQFITTNVYEWSSFQQAKRPVSIIDLVNEYNAIIEQCETDPSLKIKPV